VRGLKGLLIKSEGLLQSPALVSTPLCIIFACEIFGFCHLMRLNDSHR
jgi:hypothetical protein